MEHCFILESRDKSSVYVKRETVFISYGSHHFVWAVSQTTI